MRRLLRDVAEDQALGDTTTLADPDGGRRHQVALPRRRARRGLSALACAYSPSTGPGATSRSTPGAAVVVDIDGVLSDASRRQHYLESPRQDWRVVLRRVRRGPGDRGGARAARRCSTPTLQIVLLTARPAPGAPPHRGVAPPLRDPLGPADHAAVGRLRAGPRLQAVDGLGAAPAGFELRLAFEDDRRNVEMFRAEGIPCLYIHSGYYD